MRVAFAVVLATGAVASAEHLAAAAAVVRTAAAPVNIAGTWKCCGSGGAAAHTMDITDKAGVLGGKALQPGGTQFATISGSVSGRHVDIVETYNSFAPGYVGTLIGTVAGDAKRMSGTWTSNRAQSGTWSATLAGPPPPVLGKSVDAAPVSGTVLLELPRKHVFVRLRKGERVPLGSTVDTTHGVVSVTAADHAGQTIEGRFYAGPFRVTQAHTRVAEVTVLTLAGPKLSGCGKALDATSARKHPHRSLWGRATGNFRTAGNYGSAAVRGTKWLTEETCAGTLFTVTEGAVTVDDFPHHRIFVLTAPHSFLAHPGKGG